LARHFREAEGLSIGEIADRLGRSPATIKAYFYDPTGEKARAVKARYVGVCRGCGAYTQPRNGKGDAYTYCKACHPGAIQRRWTRERVLEAMGEWLDRVREASLVVRLGAHARAPARGRASQEADPRGVAGGGCCHQAIRHMDGCARRGVAASRGRQTGGLMPKGPVPRPGLDGKELHQLERDHLSMCSEHTVRMHRPHPSQHLPRRAWAPEPHRDGRGGRHGG
jgi:hypothetical protein